MGWHGPTGACGCCGGCRKVGFFAGTEPGLLDSTYTATRLFAAFAIQEGATEAGTYNQPNLAGATLPGSFSSRIDLDTGERMRPPAAVLASDAEAWFHMVELDGDADLEWDGGIIELRASAGTVTAGGETVPILADTESATYRSRLVLYVSPEWYGVFVMRYHQTNRLGTSTPQWITTRGSMQVIDRSNDTAAREVTLTGVDGAKVYLWTIADASVRVSGGYEYGEVTDRCSVPELPAGTETAWLHHTAGTLSYNYFGTPRTYPDTFDLDDDPEVTSGGSTGRVSGGYAGVFILDVSFPWSDVIDGNNFTLDGDLLGTIGSGYFGPLVSGGARGSIQYRTAFYVDAAAALAVDFYHRSIWRNGTAAEPYRRPVVRHYFRAAQPPQFETTWADVVPAADGTAAATLSVFVGYNAAVFAAFAIAFTDCVMGWSGE